MKFIDRKLIMIKLSTELLIINHKMMVAKNIAWIIFSSKVSKPNKTQIPGMIISSYGTYHSHYIHSNLPSLNAVTMNLKPLPISLLFISPFVLVL